MKRFRVAALIFSSALPLTGAASAQVSCADPDNLCTGDPCTTGDIEVQSPCVVDFSPRTLIIGNTLLVPDGGTLSLTAGAIEVNGRIIARGQNGSSITLASAGTIVLNKSINATGRQTPGSITLNAAGDVTLDAMLKAGGPSSSGGTVSVESTGGDLIATRAGRVMVRSRTSETGGTAILRGASSVALDGKILADGGFGGAIEASSDSGNVLVTRRMRAQGKSSAGGQIAISAGTASGTATIDEKVEAPGASDGGDIAISGAAVVVNAKVRARGRTGDGGDIGLSATSVVTVNNDISVRGNERGGTITIGAAAGTTQTIVVADRLDARGRLGGKIELGATGATTIEDRVDVDAHGVDFGGCVRVTGASVTTGPNTDFEAGARDPLPGSAGEMRFLATAGNMILSDDFDVADDGIIDAFASGNLTAIGDFDASPTGCVGLDAGGALDTSGAEVDPALSSDCPGVAACSLF